MDWEHLRHFSAFAQRGSLAAAARLLGVEHATVARRIAALEAALADLKSDPEIATLHEEAVRLHRAKRDELLAQPSYQAMRDQLRAAPALPPQEEALLRDLGLWTKEAAQ